MTVQPHPGFVLTEEEQRLLPTDEDVQFYEEHGWYLSAKLFTDEETERLQEAGELFYAGHRDRTLPSRPPHLAYWEPGDGAIQRHNDYIHYESGMIGAILR